MEEGKGDCCKKKYSSIHFVKKIDLEKVDSSGSDDLFYEKPVK